MSVHWTSDGGVAVLTLDRPEAGNALDDHMLHAFAASAAAIAADASVRAVLVRAEGRNFCVGGDLKAFPDGPARQPFLRDIVDAFHRGVRDLRARGVPVVAEVQGTAAGGGLSLVAVADLVVAAPSTRFVVAYGAIGLSHDGGASWTLARILGPRLAHELLLTNRALDATEAHRAGLVTHLVEESEVTVTARELATTLAAGPTAAFVAGKRLVESAAGHDLDTHLALERGSMVDLSATHDGTEGVAAFLDRRRPAFRGN